MILRNQTASVLCRNRRKDARRLQNQSSDQQIRSTMPKGLSQSVEIRALTFLFKSSTIVYKKDRRSSHGHLDFLQNLYDRVTSDSALALATTWFAVLILGLCDKSGRLYRRELNRLLSRAIRSVSEAIENPRDSITKETLTAVVLLAHGEHLQYTKKQSDLKPNLLVHQDGAEALIRKRDRLNFQDSTSIALFNAVRHNAVSMAFAGVRPIRENWAMWAVDSDDQARQLCDCYTLATELDACCLSILSLKDKMMCADVSGYAELQTELSSLLERLRCWQHALPSEWFLGLPAGTHSETKSLEVCYLFNDWNLLQLAVRHLLKELRLNTIGPGFYASDFSDELDLIDNVMASESLFIVAEQSAGSDPEKIDVEIQGRRLFRQTTEKLGLIVSYALQKLALPHTVTLCYREVLSWVRKERFRGECYDST